MKKKLEVIIVILAIVIIALFVYISKYSPASKDSDVKDQGKSTPVHTLISMVDEDIKEDNFTGTKSVITGSGVLADRARAYIEETVVSFKKSADEEVPPMRLQFGSDSPSANYEIDIKATYVKNVKTESIIIEEYIYTGGANGNSLYKVFTASLSTGKILSLADIIMSSKQAEFTAFIKKELMNWRPEGSKDPVVFPEEVKELGFASFDNWSLTDKNLIIYFDKYAIGPGVLGAVAFPLPLSKIQNFLVE